MHFRQDDLGRNFYYARQEPHWFPQDKHRTTYLWIRNPDRRRGGPLLLGCLHHDTQRIVKYRLNLGSYRTIQFPDLQQYWMECGR